MKEVRKKSVDPAVNQLLIKAYRQKDELIWDRVDAMQPQDGFGRLGLSCTECYEGPCRVNPFDALDQETACGKDKYDLAAGTLLRRVQDGASALLGLALDRGADVDGKACRAACFAGDVMASRDGLGDCLAETGAQISGLLNALASVGDARGGSAPAAVAANMGALKADTANVVILGHAHPEFVNRLRKRAEAAGISINMLTICGNESGSGLSLLTNYDSQELPVLTGAVDLIVFGRQCVMPATLRLAERLGTPTMYAAESLNDDKADLALAEAVAHLRKRGPSVDIPDFTEQAVVGAGPATLDALRSAHAKGACKGFVYLGGCGNIRHTQDADLIALAKSLMDAGFMLISSGCTGTALAKAGLCRPDGPLSVLHLGACHDTRVVQELSAAVKDLPVFAVMPELAHGKTLAVAVALGASGLPVFVSQAAVPGLSAEDMGNVLTPVEDFTDLARVLADKCA